MTLTKKEIMNKSLSAMTINIGKAGINDNVIEEIDIKEKTNKIGTTVHNILHQLILNNGDFNVSLKTELLESLEESKDVLEGDIVE